MDEPHLTWKVAAVIAWASALSGWLVAAAALRALGLVKQPQQATEKSPVPFSPRSIP